MADFNVLSNDSIIIRIDKSGTGTEAFYVQHDAGTTVLTAFEDGRLEINDAWARGAPHQFDNTSGSGHILDFESGDPSAGGAVVGSINNAGKGIFDQGYMNLLVVTANPDGSLPGNAGDMLIYNDTSTDWPLMICHGSTVWKRAGT